jgi:hypothetical protein
VDLVWILDVGHGVTNKMSMEIEYIAHSHVFEFLEDKQSDVKILVEWNTKKFTPTKGYQNPSVNNHLMHIKYSVMFHAFVFSFKTLFINTYDPYHRYVLYVQMCLWP